MTRNDALNLFVMVRSVGLAIAATGLIILLGYFMVASTLHALPTLAMAAMLGAAGLGLLLAGIVLALICSMAGLLVSRTHFRIDSEHPHAQL